MQIEHEKAVLTDVLNDLMANGYTITRAFDSEEYMDKADLAAAVEGKDIKPIVEWASGADEGAITLKDDQGDRFSLHMVYGNDPLEVIADMSASNEDALSRGEAIVGNCLDDLDSDQSTGPSM